MPPVPALILQALPDFAPDMIALLEVPVLRAVSKGASRHPELLVRALRLASAINIAARQVQCELKDTWDFVKALGDPVGVERYRQGLILAVAAESSWHCMPTGAARTRLLRSLPVAERPWWITQQECIAEHVHGGRFCGRTYVARCYWCSAAVCRDHSLPIGKAKVASDNKTRRLGGGQLRCADTRECDMRIRHNLVVLS